MSAHDVRSQQSGVAAIRGTIKTAEGAAPDDITVVLLPPPGTAPAVRCTLASKGSFAFEPGAIDGHILAVAPGEVASRCSEPAVIDTLRRGALPIQPLSSAENLIIDLVVVADPAPRIVSARMSTTVSVGPPGPGDALPPGAPRPPTMNAPGRGRLGRTRPGAISGRLTGPDGTPLAGVAIQVALRSSTDPTAVLLPFGQGITADDGTYRITNVPDGQVLVIALALRFEVGALELPRPAIPSVVEPGGDRSGFYTTYFPGVSAAADARPVAVRGAAVSGVDFMMLRGPVARVSGRVLGAEGRFFPMGWLTLRSQELIEQVGGRNVRRADLRQDGRFAFDDVPAGEYRLLVNGPAGWASESVVVPERRAPDPLEITLRPNFSVSGRVRIEAMRVSVDAAVLERIQVELRQAHRSTGSPLLRAKIDRDGGFRIDAVPGDRYILTVAAPTFWIPLSGTIDGRDTLDAPVDLTHSATDAVLVLTDQETNLRGVVRGNDGRPVTSARVVIYSEDRQHWKPTGSRRVRLVTTAPGGRFTATGLPPGHYLAAAFPLDTRITNSVLEASQRVATRFELAIGESRAVDVVVTK